MYRKQFGNLCILVLLSALFLTLGTLKIKQDARRSRLNEEILLQNCFRRQYVDEKTAKYIQEENDPGSLLGLYWLETNYGENIFAYERCPATFQFLKSQWDTEENYDSYMEICTAIWDDAEYFPVPEASNDTSFTVSFTDSWMDQRTYGGERGHEGTDIMASRNERGLYPVISITDGVVENKGWLEKGGYRLGISAPGGAYFYYAHLDSYANINVGDKICAGDILGYMGDTGYGPEGTHGKFPVHLHVGIYIYPSGQEISVNPYQVLRYLESRKLKVQFRDFF